MIQFLKKWRQASSNRRQIDFLFGDCPPTTASLRIRIHWLKDVLQWIRAEKTLNNELDFQSG